MVAGAIYAYESEVNIAGSARFASGFAVHSGGETVPTASRSCVFTDNPNFLSTVAKM